MACENCMSHRPDNRNGKIDNEFICPECGQQHKLAGVGPGNYWEEHGITTINPKLIDIPLERFLSEMDRREQIQQLRDQIKELQQIDAQLSRMYPRYILIEIEHRKKLREEGLKP